MLKEREMESDPRKFSCLGFSVFFYALRCHYLMVFVDVHFGFRFWNRNLPIVEEGRKTCNWKNNIWGIPLFVVWTRIWLRVNSDHDSMNAGIWSNVLYCFFGQKPSCSKEQNTLKKYSRFFYIFFFIWSSRTQLNPHEKMDVALSWYPTLKISLGPRVPQVS